MRLFLSKKSRGWLARLDKGEKERVHVYLNRLAEFGRLMADPPTDHLNGPFFEILPTADLIEIRDSQAIDDLACVSAGDEPMDWEEYKHKRLSAAKRRALAEDIVAIAPRVHARLERVVSAHAMHRFAGGMELQTHIRLCHGAG